MTLTKGNGGREGGREGTKVGCVIEGGSGGPPPEKKLEFRSSEIDSDAI